MEAKALPPFDLRPMEAEPVDVLPEGDDWLYEPKYDGFRCLAFRDGDMVRMQSKNQKPLERYFPEIANALADYPVPRFALDGEIIIPGDFETLQLRLHPSDKRAALLAREHPAQLVAFDLLADQDGVLQSRPFKERRAALEKFFDRDHGDPTIQLGIATTSTDVAKSWIGKVGLDGTMAKRLDLPYRPGVRAMRKFKLWKTIDCVVGGLYLEPGTDRVDSLLLGLYDEAGKLNFVGHSRVTRDAEEIGSMLKQIVGGKGFTGRSPGSVNRWSGKRRDVVPLKPVLVAEVSTDHITGERMRHGSRLLRWRTDKRPEDCTMDQIR